MNSRKFAFFILFISFKCFAGEIARDNLDALFYTPSAAATDTVLREFECIRSKVDAAHAMIRRPETWAMVKKFSSRLDNSFNKLGFTGFERVFFYSQALAETGGFSQMAESKDFKAVSSGKEQLFADVANDPKFAAKAGAVKSENFGSFRGRGLVQISRCDNLISAIHYMNLAERGKKPIWVSGWTYHVGGKEIPIKTVCTEEQIKPFESEYRARFGMDADAYGVLREPRRLSMVDANWQDKVTQKTIPSEQLMVNASMAYWRGRCGDVIRNILTPARLAAFEPCQKFAGGPYMEHAIKCMTSCVRGTVDGWQERLKWSEYALSCFQGGVERDKAAFQK